MEENVYEVDRVLDVRSTKRGKRYLIRWKRFENDSWEPEENLLNCQDAIDLFYAEKEKEDQIEKESQLRPNNPKSVKKVKQETEVKTEIRSTRKVVVRKRETEIRVTPLTRRSVRLSQKSETQMTQPEELLLKTESPKLKICAEKKKCPVKYFAYILCFILAFVIVLMSLPLLIN